MVASWFLPYNVESVGSIIDVKNADPKSKKR